MSLDERISRLEGKIPQMSKEEYQRAMFILTRFLRTTPELGVGITHPGDEATEFAMGIPPTTEEMQFLIKTIEKISNYKGQII